MRLLDAPIGTGSPVAPVFTEVLGGAARRLRAKLATRTGRDAPVRVGEPYACTLAELIANASPGGSLWCVFPVVAGGPPALVVVETALLASLIGRLFGAPDSDPSRARSGGPTEVERSIGARMSRELIEAMVDCWTGGPTPRFTVGETAPSPRVCGGLDPESRYVAVPMEIGTHDNPLGTVCIALPAPIVPGAAPIPLPPPAPPPPTARLPHFDRVLPVQVDLVVELARFTVPLRALRGLMVGHELMLGPPTPAIGRVGDRPAFTGEAGTQGGVRSLRVTGRAQTDSSPAGGNR